jgi:hypothetical protein
VTIESDGDAIVVAARAMAAFAGIAPATPEADALPHFMSSWLSDER